MLEHGSYRGWIVSLAVCMVFGCAGMPASLWNQNPKPAPGDPAIAKAAPPKPEEAGSTRTQPTVTGSQLNLKPDETLTQKALELSQKLNAAEEEQKAQALRTQQLEAALEEKDKTLLQATKEIQSASEELTRARADLQRSKQEVSTLRDKLRSAEKENLATLQSITSYLEQVLEQDKRSETSQDSAVTPKLPVMKLK